MDEADGHIASGLGRLMRKREQGCLGGSSAYMRVVINSSGAALLVCLALLFIRWRRERENQYPDLLS